MSVSVVIADDQELIRTGFRLILDGHPGIEVVGEAGDGAAAVELVRQLRPDVCLMDVRMPRVDGLAATAALKGDPRTAGTNIVVVTTFDLDDYVYGALRAGACGFVVKNSGARLLVDAVLAAVHGEALISPSTTVRLLQHLTAVHPTGPSPLTEPERNVVVRVARGRTNAEVAADLHLAPSTVKSHLNRVQTRLGVRNRVELAAWAWERGLVR